MLALTEQALKEFNPSIRVELFGQELNGESFGICKSDMLVTGHDPEQIAFGNTLTNDAHRGKSFHYMLSNPPYGVDWKKYQDPIREEAQTLGTEGRFGVPAALIESFSLDDVRAAISEALERGVIGFDAVKHLVLCRIEKRPPRLNLLAHPYLPRAEVATTSARSYMGLLKGAAP